ncbi:MAG: hypothetical protein QNK26_16820 [Moritella sp.]|uniref:hypothetical protein n=1 Tax=Moritella sp. TaxID=78556 RepID=UPI0029A3029D|nr:hypothetical protein [Moritella sp.]MDX2322251.1 hypothetical protein [Moritella sp.]
MEQSKSLTDDLGILTADSAEKKLRSDFRVKGMSTALFSGLSYGFYTAFMTLAMSMGIWTVWYGEGSGLSAFATTFLLAAIGAALTDSCSAVWALGIAAARGRLGDFFRSIRTKPGAIMVGSAIIGGPLASTAYVVGLQMAGSIVVPISALCPAIGAILARIIFKQELSPRMMLGIAICFGASVLIGGSAGLADGDTSVVMLGIGFGFIAALFWGIEGCVAGYGTSMIDPEIGITIRQVTSGLTNLLILIPLFAYIGGENGYAMVFEAVADSESIIFFVVAGLAAYGAFMFWYKGNAMCGAALGMACNGTFSFWGPLCCWLVLGIAFGIAGWTMAPIAWVAAIIMIFGIFVIAMNPMDLFKKDNNQ